MKQKIKHYMVLLILLAAALNITAQQDLTKMKVELEDGSFAVPDKSPQMIFNKWFPEKGELDFGIQGKAVIRITINEKGDVAASRIIAGINKTADKTILELVNKLKFIPAEIKNKPVKVTIAVSITFIYDNRRPGNIISFDESGRNIEVIQTSAKAGKINSGQTDSNEPDPSVFTPVEKEPMPVKQVRPVYPEEATKKGIVGLVILRVLVSKEGKPVKILVFKADNEIFIEPAKKAVMETQFSPAIVNGKPIACWLNMPYKFSIGGDKREKK